MTNEPSPRPWRAKRSPIGSNTWIVSGEVFVATVSSPADAALIVDAVNERDRLRDLVRRLVRVAQDTLEFAEAMSGIVPDNPERAKARSEITSLLREARAAIGEEKE